MVLDPGYIKLWLPIIIEGGVFVLLFALAVVALFGIWYEMYLKRTR